MILNEILKLMKCFPGSSINNDGYLLLNKQRSGFSMVQFIQFGNLMPAAKSSRKCVML